MTKRAEKFRVVHIASGDLWAGAEVQLYTLCTALKKIADAAVYAILLNEGELAKRLREAGVTVTVLPESQLSFFQLLFLTRKELNNIKPHAIHTHRQKENILGALANKMSTNCPCIRTVHGAQEHRFSIKKPQRLIQHWIDYACGNFLQDKIIAVSQALSRELQKSFSPKRVVYIPNGINPEQCILQSETTPPLLDTSPGQCNIGLVGRLTQVKRPDIFIETAKLILEQHPQANIKFHVIGSGPLEEISQQQAKQVIPDGKIKFYGHLEAATKAISELDILVLCSDHEGLPMTLLEACCVETCVVAHAVGGIAELIQNRINGLLVTQHNPQGYSDAVGELISDANLRSDLALQAKSDVIQNYSANKNAQSILELYQTGRQ